MDALWKIWFEHFDDSGKKVGTGVYWQVYKHKANAVRRAKIRFGEHNKNFKWVVSQTNPYI